jgi:2-polyprenyl-3-methyl-5-hydroxy-6-metoxy-1,4-benzoquinol methylase
MCGSERARRLSFNEGERPLYRCLACRLVHWGQTWGAAEMAQRYHDYYTGKPSEYDPITEKRYHTVLDRFEQLTSPGTLLDVGCGMGHFMAVAEARGWKAVGLEVSASGVQLLERIKAERGLRFEVRNGDISGADFPAESFKAVSLVEVLEHLSDPMACLKKIHALLEPGGILYLTTPNFDSLSRLALAGRWRAVRAEHLCLFNARTLRVCLSSAGFTSVRFVTKNIDVPEILAKWRRPRQRESLNTASATRAFRRTVEGSRLLQGLKAAANFVLRVSSLGETLEVFAIKQSAGIVLPTIQ